jgi:D-aminoacyl-tRNA deacylase
MRVVIQRVSEANVKVDNIIIGAIEIGLMVLVGVEDADTSEDILWLANKIVQMRIFNEEAGLMNKSVQDVHGNILLISQFTLHANTKKGNRPSFIKAARPEKAIPLYEEMISTLTKLLNKEIACGQFGADMKVSLVNDGPVTIFMDSKNRDGEL